MLASHVSCLKTFVQDLHICVHSQKMFVVVSVVKKTFPANKYAFSLVADYINLSEAS